MPKINIYKQSCCACNSHSAEAEYTLTIGSHKLPICRNCLQDLHESLNEIFEKSDTKMDGT